MKNLSIQPKINHFFTTKTDGNLAFHVRDNQEAVIKNHQDLAKEHGYIFENLVHMKQIHSDIVHVVYEDDNFKNPPTCDALITNRLNTPLMVMVADCSPILFYDSKQKVIAVAHAGRAGAFKNIVKNVIDKFINEFNCQTKDIHVEIGASIGVCCYEVNNTIKNEAKNLNLEYAIEIKADKYYLDISSILKKQLLTCKVKKEHIKFFQECTKCNSSKYFSYRADNKTGRFAGVIVLN